MGIFCTDIIVMVVTQLFGLTMIVASGYCLGMRKINIFLMIMMLRILS